MDKTHKLEVIDYFQDSTKSAQRILYLAPLFFIVLLIYLSVMYIIFCIDNILKNIVSLQHELRIRLGQLYFLINST